MIYRVGSEVRRLLNCSKLGSKPNLDGYRYIETLNERNTTKGHKWGAYHANNLSQYWSDDNVIWVDDKVILTTKLEPKEFDNNIVIPYSIGVVESKNAYKYGYFEAIGHFPISKGQWPAFWLTGANSWPPEIDIVEGYSKGDTYNNARRLQSNVHYTVDGIKKMAGAVNHPLMKHDKSQQSMHVHGHFAMLWEADKIEFYYNGYLVRRITSKKVLDAMNEPMKVMVNSAVQIDYKPAKSAFTSFREINIWQKL